MTGARALVAIAAIAAMPGCGFALAQTAKVQPKEVFTGQAGLGGLTSQTDTDRGGGNLANVTSELGLRAGVGSNVDLGAAGYMGAGALIDAKWSLLDQGRREAIALRGGVGAAAPTAARDVVAADAAIPMVLKLRESGRNVEYCAFPMLDLKIKNYWKR